MKKYSREDIETLLVAVDKEMSRPFDLIIIGGTAAALGYQVTSYTKDIDTVNRINQIEDAYQRAKVETGLDIPMGPVGVEDGPYHYEDRLVEHHIEGLRKLRIFLPEQHDLILMKIVRGYAHDIATALEIQKVSALSFDTFLDRMKHEMTHVTGRKLLILGNFLALMEALYGEDVAIVAESHLKGWDER